MVKSFSDLVHAGLPAREGFGGDLEGDAGFPLGEEVEEGVGSVDHHEVGAGSESGFQKLRQIGIPDALVFYEGEYLGLSVRNGSGGGVGWHKCFVLGYKGHLAGKCLLGIESLQILATLP